MLGPIEVVLYLEVVDPFRIEVVLNDFRPTVVYIVAMLAILYLQSAKWVTLRNQVKICEVFSRDKELDA